MIKAIEGVVTKKTPTKILLKAFGVSYEVNLSLNSSSKINLGDSVEILITQILKEDSDNFYGFLEENEQKMFELLIKLNGIGAVSAMAICSNFSFDEFLTCIQSGNFNVLTNVPGIGLKTARRIVAELSDAKIVDSQSLPDYKKETILALESLGFKKDKITKILTTCEGKTTQDLIKEALKKLA